MVDHDYVIDLFKKNFSDYVNKNLVLYGISNNTKVVLNNFSHFNIVGVMDGYLDRGEIYNKKILSYEDLEVYKVETIIIIARPSSTKIIYRRIGEFCRKNGIEVYNLEGENLNDKISELEVDDEYFKLNKEAIKDKIDEFEVISFDIFDTLIMRKTLYPTDVFEIVKRKLDKKITDKLDFISERIRAEAELLQSRYPTFDMIYEKLKQNNNTLNEDDINQLKKFELESEEDVLIPRKEMIELFHYALGVGKSVYLVSDMYLTSMELEPLLRKNNIIGYKKLIISSEMGTTKCQELFKVLKSNISGKKCLHIGDNEDADFIAAHKNGIDAIHIKKAVDLLEISTYKELINYTNSFENRCMIGLFVSNAFNNPFILYNTKGKLNIVDYESFAYLFIGPMVSSYILELIKYIEERKYDKILFLARDGYLLKKIYDLAISYKLGGKEVPKSIYFLVSRIPCIVGIINELEDIKETVKIGYAGTPEEVLRHRFLLESEQIQEYNSGLGLEEYVINHSSKILKKAHEIRKGYNIYANSLGIEKDDKILVVDLAASGTCQMALEKILHSKYDGFYFARIWDGSEDKKKLHINALFNIDNSFSKESFLCESYIVLESILTSFSASVRSIDGKGKHEFVTDTRSVHQIRDLEKSHQAIIDYFEQYINIMFSRECDVNLADKLLSFMQKRYTRVKDIRLMEEELQDEFFNRTYKFNEVIE